MASTKEGDTAAAAQHLGFMSLSGSAVGRKDTDKDTGESTAKNGTTPTTKLCSACGKKSDALKKCNGCKCVWYCDKECQNKHRKEHKHECRPIKTELEKRGGKLNLGDEMDIGPLGKLPPREECPICMRVLPIHERLHMYALCCGKFICSGCKFQHTMKRDQSTCPFCRTKLPESDEEMLVQLRKRVELKDPHALNNMAMEHGFGRLGLPINQAKCLELVREAAALGCPTAQYELGSFHAQGKMGLEQNEEEALNHWKKAAEDGQLLALYNVGLVEGRNSNDVAGMRHCRLAASGGHKRSIKVLMSCFEGGVLQHGDLADTLQAFYLAKGEMKSEDRDQYIQHLKMTGEYAEELEW